MPAIIPRVFISYSHDSETHENWVLTLATRLVANGVKLLDQWDLRPGSDLPRFMESGLSSADWRLKWQNGISGLMMSRDRN